MFLHTKKKQKSPDLRGFFVEGLNGYFRPLAIGARATFPPLSIK